MEGPQIDPFYTQFRYHQLSEVNDRFIGLATFTVSKPFYPTQAIVKIVPFLSRQRNEGANAIRLNVLTNVVQTYAYYVVRGCLVVFMKYYEESSLDKYLAKLRENGGQLTEITMLTMMVDIAKAVHSFHSHRFAHRDIKPHNVFLTADLRCKLGDLESTKEIAEQDWASLQSQHAGTPNYMSPERVNLYKKGSAPTCNHEAFSEDIYALGKTFYDMCSGGTDEEQMPQIEESLSEKIRGKVLIRGYSPQLADLIIEMMLEPPNTEHVLTVLTRMLETLQPPQPSLVVHSPVAHSPVTHSSVPQRSPAVPPSKDRTFPLHHAAPAPVPTIRCERCKPRIPPSAIKLPNCPHSYCTPCLSRLLTEQLNDPRTKFIEDINCPCCNRPIDLSFLKNQKDCINEAMLAKLEMLYELSQVGTCFCHLLRTYSKVTHNPNTPPEPYVYTFSGCKCKGKICSWCGKIGGHQHFYGQRKCKGFPYYR